MSKTRRLKAERQERQKNVLYAVGKLAPWGGFGGVWTSRIAEETGLTIRQVAGALRSLQGLGLVERDSRTPVPRSAGGRPWRYEPGCYLERAGRAALAYFTDLDIVISW